MMYWSKFMLLSLPVFLALTQVVQSYNILFALPFGSRSHKNVFDPVAEELGRRGHKVAMFSGIEEKVDPPGVKSYYAEEIFELFVAKNISFFQGSISSSSVMADMLQSIYEMCELVYNNPFIADIVKEPIDPVTKKPKYDIVIVDSVFNDFMLALGHHMGVPNILFSPSSHFHHHSWNLDIPFPLSYIPSAFDEYPDPMDFVSRIKSSFSQLFFLYLLNGIVLPNEDIILKKHIPNLPSLIEIQRNVSFLLSNTVPALHIRKPGMPYSAEVGGLNCKPAKPLPEDLEAFMKSAGKDGVIYFSLGSVTRGDSMPLDMRDKVLKVFSKLPQKIIWKYEKDIPSMPANIKLVKWAPQQDILAHPNIRLFITHGGLLSASEAAYHGCPILGFPLSADQLSNMVQLKRQGVAEYFDWKTFTEEEFHETIKRMINDKSYKEKSIFSSQLMKDRPQNPIETAAYWIEYVIRHNGAPFLKSSATHLNFFQYFLLDIVGALFVVLVILGVILFYVLKCSLKLAASVCRLAGFCKKAAPKKPKGKKKTN